MSLWGDYKRRRIKSALTDAYDRCRAEERAIDLEHQPVVIFSDHHKGSRDHADDFWRSEAAYNAALGYYLEAGYTLVVLGDAEELWEETARPVLDAYANTLRLEGEFLARDHYERVWGNHDLDWADEEAVSRLLGPALGQNAKELRVREALCLGVSSGGRRLGDLFLVHGHQGTLDSDILAWISKPWVRLGRANLQRRGPRSSNTPSRDHRLRADHDRTIFEWAQARPENPVLIAGHTHRPVFWARERDPEDRRRLEAELAELRARGASPNELAPHRARVEAARAQTETTPDLAPVDMSTPCYFNTGCCAYADGSVTGIELAEGSIRLVRWPWPYGTQRPERQELDALPLSLVFAAVKGSPRA